MIFVGSPGWSRTTISFHEQEAIMIRKGSDIELQDYNDVLLAVMISIVKW